MKPMFECLRCLLTVRLREVENSYLSEVEKLAVSKELLELVRGVFDYSTDLTQIATLLFNFVVSKAPGVREYYTKIRKIANEKTLETVHTHVNHAEKLSGFQKFRYLVKLSAIGNLIDYGVAGYTAMEPQYITPSYVENYEFCIDCTRDFYELVLSGGRRIVWLFDNCGEVIYDLLLISELRKLGNSIMGFVKENPGFQNDVTIEDAVSLKLERALDGIVAYGFASTIHLDKINVDAKRALEEADLVVAKGMSHFEYLIDVDLGKPITFILIPKCIPVAMKAGGAGCYGKIVVLLRNDLSKSTPRA